MKWHLKNINRNRVNGVIGRTFDVSQPVAQPLRAKEARPMSRSSFSMTGFGQIGCFGGPLRTQPGCLAKNCLRYNNMHTTALCSPTRSCLITGRNHHSNAMSCITEGSTGYPGGNGNIPFENGFLSEMLLQHGYNTYALGKWHLTPADQLSAAGPYDRWPLGRGFERFFGFLGGETHQYYPELVSDNHTVEAEVPKRFSTRPRFGGPAIAHRRRQTGRPNKPFFWLLPGHGPRAHVTCRRNGRKVQRQI